MLHNCGAVDGMLAEYQLQTWDGLGIKCDAARAVGTPRGRLGLRFDITGAGLGHSTAVTSDQLKTLLKWHGWDCAPQQRCYLLPRRPHRPIVRALI